MSDKYVLDDSGNPVPCDDIFTWGRWFEDPTKRRVAMTETGDVRVSTVFLGLNHRFSDGPPLIYETMIFGGPHDSYQQRYSTKEEALEGHAEAVKLAGIDKPPLKNKEVEE